MLFYQLCYQSYELTWVKFIFAISVCFLYQIV